MIERRAVLAAVEAALAEASGLPVGVGRLPDGSPPPPYFVISPTTHTVSGAPFSDLSEDASTVVQITCVAEQTDQALWAADRGAALVARDLATGAWAVPLTVDGADVIGRSLEVEAGETSDPGAAIVSYVLRIRFDLTTADA